jgi:hypothetical protein
MTNLQKKEIVETIKNEIPRLGSQGNLARKCKVSPATISQMLAENWDLISPEMWQKVASAIGHNSSEWETVETLPYNKLVQNLKIAKEASMFLMYSDDAGKGKTATLKHYCKQNTESNVFYLNCREWAKRELVEELCTQLGIEYGNISSDKKGLLIIEFFEKKSNKKPQLLIDEIDKLRDPALRWFIEFYNALEGKISIVSSGGPHLEQRIKRGVKLKKQGYSEINSRFSGILKIYGTRLEDCTKICVANGITDKSVINNIWKEQEKVFEDFEFEPGKFLSIKVITDLRRLKRVIQRELLKMKI